MDITSCELDLLLYIYRGCNSSQAEWEGPDNSFEHRGENVLRRDGNWRARIVYLQRKLQVCIRV